MLTPDSRPRCPDCRRPVHRLPSGRLLTVMPGLPTGLGPHVCLPPAVRYGLPAIQERPACSLDLIH